LNCSCAAALAPSSREIDHQHDDIRPHRSAAVKGKAEFRQQGAENAHRPTH
jgi:hypothetical protein